MVTIASPSLSDLLLSLLYPFHPCAFHDRRQKFPWPVFHVRDRSRDRRPVHMYVPDGQENAPSLSRLSRVLFIRDHHHAAVAGRHHRPRFRGNRAFRIAKEREDERGE